MAEDFEAQSSESCGARTKIMLGATRMHTSRCERFLLDLFGMLRELSRSE